MTATSNKKSAQQTGLVSQLRRSYLPSNHRPSSRSSRLWLLAALTLSLIPAGRAALAQETSEAPASQPVFPASGVYLYGEAPQPEQMGMGYMVFEMENQRLVGALYVPNSSFDCFEGQVQDSEIAMTITNSYSQEAYPYAVALETNDAIASTASDAPAPLSLDGFHQLAAPSENDLRILATCKANLQQ